MARPRLVTFGVTRLVLVTDRWAFKAPQPHALLRGWLANRSEWVNRRRPGVNRPSWTAGYVLSCYPAAERLVQVELGGVWSDLIPALAGDDLSQEERKPSAWGWFGDEWRLLDYDVAWRHPRGLVGGLYYWNQERLARRWMRLPQAD